MTAIENKIPNISNLAKKKTDYERKISEIEKEFTNHNHDKYITNPEFNKLTSENFAARLTKANLIAKTDFDNRLMSLKKLEKFLMSLRTITSNKTKHVLVENELKN